MSLKKLNQFRKFDIVEFLKAKDVRVVSQEPWQEKTPDGYQIIGTKLKCLILVDNTDYGAPAHKGLNDGEALVVKVPKTPIEFQKFARLELISPTATVYGEFQNQLSIKAADVRFHAAK